MDTISPLSGAQSTELRQSPSSQTIADLNLGPLWEVRVVQWIRGQQKTRYNQLSEEDRSALREEATRLSAQEGIEALHKWRAEHREPYTSNMPTALAVLEEVLKQRGLASTSSK